MSYYETFTDAKRGQGEGGALYVKLPGQAMYSFVMPMETVPLLIGARESFEYTPTTSPTKGKITGRYEIEDKDFQFLAHRDNFMRADELKDQSLPYLVVNPDYSGWKYMATLSYRQDDITNGDALKATGTLVGQEINIDRIDDVIPLLMPTAKFVSPVPPMVALETATGKYEFTVETLPASATITVTTNQTGGFTATVLDKKVTITGTNSSQTAAVTGIVSIKTEMDGYAPWTTTIHVTVPKATT